MSNHSPLPRSHLLSGKRIAIIGAGPAGLTLARLLELQGVSVRVYERDAGPQARPQGGSLDLHEESGQLALSRCGLSEQFKAVYRPEGQATAIVDKHGVRWAAMKAEDEEAFRPEIDRTKLRSLLLSSVGKETVLWNHPLSKVATEGQQHRLVFASGETDIVDLIIGADGLRSQVRSLITTIPASYTGVSFIETRLTDVDNRLPDIARYVGPGSVLALSDYKGLLAQRNGDGSIRVYAAKRMSEAELNSLDLKNPPKAREQILTWFEDWAPEVSALLRLSDASFLPWPLYAVPPEQAWATLPGATIIGNAAHVMPPFLGAGANMAMLDAVDLAYHLSREDYKDLTEALAAFEQLMLTRMKPYIEGSLATQNVLFEIDAPKGLVSQLKATKVPQP